MSRAWRAGAWILAIGGMGSVVTTAVVPIGETTLDDTPPRRSESETPREARYPADSFAQAATGRNVFRTQRRPASMAYDAQALVAAANTPPTPKPVLALVGIVAGREPSAVLEGLPGTDGPRVVRVGDRWAGLRVTRIGRAEVRIVGLDTVWVLTVREPWR